MLPFLLLLCALTGVASSEIASPPPLPPPSSSMTLETWELALIVGCGTFALLMCAYSVYILTRRRRTPPKPLTKVVVNMEVGRGKKDSKTVDKKQTKPAETKTVDKKQTKPAETKTVDKKKTTPAETKESKAASSSTKEEAGAEVIAIKIQPNNYAVTCPGGSKACIGPRKDGVQIVSKTRPSTPSKPRRVSAPTKLQGGARMSAPRV